MVEEVGRAVEKLATKDELKRQVDLVLEVAAKKLTDGEAARSRQAQHAMAEEARRGDEVEQVRALRVVSINPAIL